jgi:CubicO group peptidase (beta-lactamase class C family)
MPRRAKTTTETSGACSRTGCDKRVRVALAIVHEGGAAHLRGFGHDGRGNPISADTSFPIGSLTNSFTALLVRRAVEAGQFEADAPVQRYLPWFRVADAHASARITLHHLLNQTSGFSRADGIAPLLLGSTASITELARGLATVSLNRPVGERFEYSNLNFVLLGAVLQAVTDRSWQALVQMQVQVLQPLQMTHSHTDHQAARAAGMTALHRIWFGMPVAQQVSLLPGFAPDLALLVAAVLSSLCLPAAWRAAPWLRRVWLRKTGVRSS